MIFVDVIIQNKSDNTDVLYTYGSEISLSVGQRVFVPFGQGNKTKEAYVIKVYNDLPKDIKNLKYVVGIDETMALNEEIIETAMFMKRRYFCRTIDAIQCFVPPGKPLKSGKKRLPAAFGENVLSSTAKPLNEGQQAAKDSITASIINQEGKLFLLNGITGSGKTEVYMQCAEEALNSGKSVIIMVPEISLTPQTLERFLSRFGEKKVAILHSKLSNGERYDEWQRIRNGEAQIVIGARSAVFAPLKNIGLIVLDEEHESSYKSDMSPKYECVEVAIKRLKTYKGTLVLGSATPSIVSYFRAKQGIYDLIELKNRYNMNPLPKVSIVDMRKELLEGNKSILSRRLFSDIELALGKNEQIILFLNRRGYSTFVSCRECGYVAECTECGISMSYHKTTDSLKCHYCGRKSKPPVLCPKCGSKYIKYFGTGTQKVEEFIREHFPSARIDRLDYDTVKSKGSVTKIIKNFQKAKTDILIGTQMVAKGIDVGNVSVVGIIAADVSLNIPDFRAQERTFQLITQAAGRAGRGAEQGKVVVQTYSPEHFAVECASRHNYEDFYKKEIEQRRLLKYPPFSEIFMLAFVSENQEAARLGAEEAHLWLMNNLPENLKEKLYNVQKSYLNKENGKYKYQILLKIPMGTRNSCGAYIDILRSEIINKKKREYLFIVDVNPSSFT